MILHCILQFSGETVQHGNSVVRWCCGILDVCTRASAHTHTYTHTHTRSHKHTHARAPAAGRRTPRPATATATSPPSPSRAPTASWASPRGSCRPRVSAGGVLAGAGWLHRMAHLRAGGQWAALEAAGGEGGGGECSSWGQMCSSGCQHACAHTPMFRSRLPLTHTHCRQGSAGGIWGWVRYMHTQLRACTHTHTHTHTRNHTHTLCRQGHARGLWGGVRLPPRARDQQSGLQPVHQHARIRVSGGGGGGGGLCRGPQVLFAGLRRQ